MWMATGRRCGSIQYLITCPVLERSHIISFVKLNETLLLPHILNVANMNETYTHIHTLYEWRKKMIKETYFIYTNNDF